MVKAARIIPPTVRDTQRRASDPAASSFVSANAGSGKTHVLVQRVIRLLLDGVPPEKILCITFTKAAAANMAERVFTTLGHWVTLDDDALDAAIKETGIAHPGTRLRKSARKLFACALETPGGLKVQTIHALCTRLLQQFPFEANVPARFAVLDDRDQNEMMERANLGVFLEASRHPDSATGRALMTAMASAADVTFKDVVREACLSRDHFMAWTDAAGSAQIAATQISAALGVDPNDRIEDVERDILDGPHLPRSEWEAVALVLETGSKTDQDQAARLRGALVFSGAAQVDEYLGVFLTEADRTPRKSVVTKKFCDNNPAIGRLIELEARRIPPLIARRRAVVARDRTEALLYIATAAAANYRREKQERGLLDYDDLIDKTLAMLDRVSSGWVHYKLDRGVDHVLIDEAQDTSPRQWDIVDHIISEFTSGAGARDGVVRTVFAVGDEKQSIFSFQGAAPREFDQRRRALQRKFEGAGLKFDPVSFTYSFRSGPAILHAVDQVFREQDIFRSIHAVDIGNPIHHALADAGPSQIDLWELAEADDRQDIEGWRAPFDGVAATSPEVKLSRRIQAEIKTLVGSGAMTGSNNDRRRLRYGDMLVLVRRRGNAFDAVIQALKHAGIPVAGADRLKLTEHIAIIDLMNLADALLLPQDDLALAVALKSPLFGLTDDDLFTISWQRKGSLRAALSERASADGRLRDALWRLEQCERRFAHQTPFAFYAWLLGGDGGRARILRRLGHEANDALDEFLELALNYERKAPASLQGFMAWLRTADLEVKRDMEISRDEVRVMTVHGAKGLEFFGRVPGGHHDLALGYAAAEAHQPVAGQCRSARARRGGVGRPQGRGPAGRRRGPRGDDRRYRGRIPPPALCRDDARRRQADRRRLPARQHEKRSAAILVRSDHQGARRIRPAASGDRNRCRPGEALCARGGDRSASRACGYTDRAGSVGAAQLAADPRTAGGSGGKFCAAIRPVGGRRPKGTYRRITRTARPRHPARHAGAPAAAIAAGYRGGAPP